MRRVRSSSRSIVPEPSSSSSAKRSSTLLLPRASERVRERQRAPERVRESQREGTHLSPLSRASGLRPALPPLPIDELWPTPRWGRSEEESPRPHQTQRERERAQQRAAACSGAHEAHGAAGPQERINLISENSIGPSGAARAVSAPPHHGAEQRQHGGAHLCALGGCAWCAAHVVICERLHLRGRLILDRFSPRCHRRRCSNTTY